MSRAKQPLAALRIEPAHGDSGYPKIFRERFVGRSRRRLGDAFGLQDFGVNLVELAPGAWSALRHWHSREDELLYVLEGRPTLVTDRGKTALGPGHVVGFAKGEPDGHHLINETAEPVRYLEIGTRTLDDVCVYPDEDMKVEGNRPDSIYTRMDGTPYD